MVSLFYPPKPLLRMNFQDAADMLGEVQPPPDTDTEMNWPNFFVVGAAKAGTTSLYTHLKRHPDVFLTDVKESAYFSPEIRAGIHRDLYRDPGRYRAMYAGANRCKAVGEVSSTYLATEGTPARIREVRRDARIVIILRDPVERAFSHYLFYRTTRDETTGESFAEALRRYENTSAKGWWMSAEYIEHGLYHSQVRRYFDAFGSEQVLVLLFDDLAKNPNELLARIARHIGVDPGFFAGLDLSEARNPYYVPKSSAVRWVQTHGLTRLLPRSLVLAVRPLFFNMKKPGLDDQSRRFLQELYAPEVTGLEELLGRKLPELRRTWV
jgi:hypothetical protein